MRGAISWFLQETTGRTSPFRSYPALFEQYPRAVLQGIAGHGFYDSCVVPIIENTARECELTGRLREAMAAYPRSNAVLVRRHGIYIWGDTWLQARVHFEDIPPCFWLL